MGWAVTLFEHSALQGRSMTFTTDTPYVGDDFDNVTSSLVVSDTGDIGVVIVYQERDFDGSSQGLLPGGYDVGQLTVGNDAISSLRIPGGWAVTLFEKGGFGGRSKTFTTDTPYVGDDFDNITSSLVVRDPGDPSVVVVYQDREFHGRSQALPRGRYNLRPLWNDAISSLHVPTGWTVALYENLDLHENPNLRGRSKTFIADAPYVGDDFENVTSSLVVSDIGIVIIYQERDFGGRSHALPPGDYILDASWNDTISSLRVPRLWSVTIFEHVDYSARYNGRYTTFRADIPYVGERYDNITSYVEVRAFLDPGGYPLL